MNTISFEKYELFIEKKYKSIIVQINKKYSYGRNKLKPPYFNSEQFFSLKGLFVPKLILNRFYLSNF